MTTVLRSAGADGPAHRLKGSLLLTGARIITQGEAGAVSGDLLVKDGKIVQLGQNLTIPADAERIDVRGMVITPGLIDVRSTLWLSRRAAGEGAGDGSLNAMDGVDFLAEDWREVARQGVTAVYVQPSSTGALGGRGLVLRVAPGRRPEQLVIQEDAGAQASLGIGGKTETSRDRYAQYEQVKKVLESAKAYGEQRKRYEAFQKSQKSEKQKSKNDDDSSKAASPTGQPAVEQKPPEKPTPDPNKDFLLTVLERKVPLRMEVHRQDDVRNALRLAKDFNLRMVFEGISNPGTSRDGLLRSRAPLVIGPILELEDTPEYRQRRPEDWISLAREAEGRWALATFGQRPRASRFLRAQAAAAVSRGIDSDRVLRAITSDAARILGLEDRLGILAPGRDADLVVFAGDPLDTSTAVRLVMSQGEIVYRSDDEQPPVVDQPASPPKGLDTQIPGAYAIVAERFMSEGGELTPGRMIVNGGRIVSLAPSLDLPEDIPIFDLGGAVVTPGLVSACSDLGLSAAIDQTPNALAAHVRASDAFDPSSTAVRDLVRGGFLTVVLAPGPANVIGGNVGLLRLGAQQPVLNEEFAVRFNLTSGARAATRFPASLAGQTGMIRDALSGQVMPLSLFLPQPIQRALAAENERALAAVRQGKRTALFHGESRAELRAALQLIEEFKLRGAVLHPGSIRPLLDDIRRLDVGVVARPATPDDYDRRADELVEAASKGVPIGFSGHSPDECRLSAALLAAAGVPRARARALLADVAARAVGAPPECGKLVEQGRADFVVWSGDPLDLRCKPLSVVVNGALVNE